MRNLGDTVYVDDFLDTTHIITEPNSWKHKWKVPREWGDKLQTGRKYLQMTYMMNYHPKYTKTFKMQQYKTQYIVK